MEELATSWRISRRDLTSGLVLGIDGGGRAIVLSVTLRMESSRQSVAGSRPIQYESSRSRGQRSPDATPSSGLRRCKSQPRTGRIGVSPGLCRRPADDQSAVRAWAARVRLAETVEVVGDVALPIAMLPGGWGIAVVAGTGSCVWGRTSDGRTARAGGWGPLLGDEGSGYAIAIDALKTICEISDGRRPAAALGGRLIASMGLTDATQLISAVHGGSWDRSRLATLAREVILAADEGEPVAGASVLGSGVIGGCLASVLAASVCARFGRAAGGLRWSPAYGSFRPPSGRPGDCARSLMVVPEPAEGALRIAAARWPGSNPWSPSINKYPRGRPSSVVETHEARHTCGGPLSFLPVVLASPWPRWWSSRPRGWRRPAHGWRP